MSPFHGPVIFKGPLACIASLADFAVKGHLVYYMQWQCHDPEQQEGRPAPLVMAVPDESSSERIPRSLLQGASIRPP